MSVSESDERIPLRDLASDRTVAAMTTALGLSIRGDELFGVAVTGTADAFTITGCDRSLLRREESLTPHLDSMRCGVDEVAAAVARSARWLTQTMTEAVGALMSLAPRGGQIDVIAVVTPRCRRVEELRKRVQRRSFAICADEHLLTDTLQAGARATGTPVLTIRPGEALERARDRFGLSRQSLGHAAELHQAELGDSFMYHHRLPALAARLAVADLMDRVHERWHVR